MGRVCSSAINDEENEEKTTEVAIQQCDIWGLYNAIALGTRDLILLDMRSAAVHKESHIEASINFDIDDENIYQHKDEEIAIKLSRYIKKKLVNTDYIYIIYDDQENDEKMNEMNEYFKTTVVPIIQNGSWLKFKTIYYCCLFKEFEDKFKFLMSTELIKIDEDDDKTQLHPMPSSIFGKEKMYPSCIIPDELYLGNSRNAKDGDSLKELGITHIVNVTTDIEKYFENDGIIYLQLKIEDNPKADIAQYFDEAIQFMHNALSDKNNRVFVHCQAGISRSSSIVIAYIMSKRNMSKLEDALDFVSKRRPIVWPNDGFQKQLIEYQNKLEQI